MVILAIVLKIQRNAVFFGLLVKKFLKSSLAAKMN